MRILFTPAGDTDPVRGYRDGAILHILRHYQVDKVILVLTKDMEEKEKSMHCYAKGIESVSPKTDLEYRYTGITEPHKFEPLTMVQDIFEEEYRAHPGAEWLVNISSGTPQLKTVMALLALDYPHIKAIQVSSPEGRSNRGNAACDTVAELVEMIELNEDNEEGAKNRCEEPPLYLLKRHGLTRQIVSLTENYEYAGALQIVRQNKDCGFAEETEKLLQHAVYRKDLMWKEANKVISAYDGKPLMDNPDDFTEYFRVMEMRARKKQYPEFIVKLSPVLMQLGLKYLKELNRFDVNRCGRQGKSGIFKLEKQQIQTNYPKLLSYMETRLTKSFSDGPFYFTHIVWICGYLKENEYRGDRRHANVAAIFEKLRIVEERTRNPVAHEITNLTDAKIQELTARSDERSPGIPGGLSADDIVKLLREAVRLIRGRDFSWNYDKLNDTIISSLRKRRKTG